MAALNTIHATRIGAALEYLRGCAGYTRRMLADKALVSEGFVQALEWGEVDLVQDRDTADAVFRVLRTDQQALSALADELAPGDPASIRASLHSTLHAPRRAEGGFGFIECGSDDLTETRVRPKGVRGFAKFLKDKLAGC